MKTFVYTDERKRRKGREGKGKNGRTEGVRGEKKKRSL